MLAGMAGFPAVIALLVATAFALSALGEAIDDSGRAGRDDDGQDDGAGQDDGPSDDDD